MIRSPQMTAEQITVPMLLLQKTQHPFASVEEVLTFSDTVGDHCAVEWLEGAPGEQKIAHEVVFEKTIEWLNAQEAK